MTIHERKQSLNLNRLPPLPPNRQQRYSNRDLTWSEKKSTSAVISSNAGKLSKIVKAKKLKLHDYNKSPKLARRKHTLSFTEELKEIKRASESTDCGEQSFSRKLTLMETPKYTISLIPS